MSETERLINSVVQGYGLYYYGGIGKIDGGTDNPVLPSERKYAIIQSLWTKPINNAEHLRKTLFIAALSLAYAHKSGYKVYMHTDSKGYELLKKFGYDKLEKTLDAIPDTVPTELFAAGKFFAMRAEGMVGCLHTDFDVFIKKPHLLDKFFEDERIDVVVQNEENYDIYCFHKDKIRPMHILGYPPATRPTWRGSLNTGVVGFNNTRLATKYMNTYFEALKMYSVEQFEAYKATDERADMHFDFILEQVNLSYMSLGYNLLTLVPMMQPTEVANRIGYTHLLGGYKWSDEYQKQIKAALKKHDIKIYNAAVLATRKIKD